jgi:hypothetical protein
MKAIPIQVSHSTHPDGIRVPQGVRVFCIGDTVVRIPGDAPNSTKIFVHPDDVEAVKAANNIT